MQVYSATGDAISLGALLGRGGEGAVYEMDGHPGLVVKLYEHPPRTELVEKLRALCRVGTPKLRGVAAWPIGLVHTTKAGLVSGFFMPGVKGHYPVHELMSPKGRRKHFPKSSWPFLVHVAQNLAKAMAAVHEEGHVIGDVNARNTLVSPRGTVAILDCDSFQIRTTHKLYTCDVGVPLYTAPELQRGSLRGRERGPNHDVFALAVLLFQLLFMGRHPFAGRHLGHGDKLAEDAIKEYRFAYGPGATARQMAQPPGTCDLAVAGPATVLFEEAFSATSARPSASRWVQALAQLRSRLRVCSIIPAHSFPAHLPSCPWCPLELSAQISFFSVLQLRGAGSASAYVAVPAGQVEGLWHKITAVNSPGPAPSLGTPNARSKKPTPAAHAVARPRLQRRIIACVLGVFGLVLTASGASGWFLFIGIGLCAGLWNYEDDSVMLPFRQAHDRARARWTQLRAQWDHTAGDGAFREMFNTLTRTRDQLRSLPDERKRRVQELTATARQRQTQTHLDRFRIEDGRIQKIGAGRSSMLASYGIETAGDIDYARVQSVPGFGPVLARSLTSWAQTVKSRFRFDPTRAVTSQDIAQVDQDVLRRQRQHLQALEAGASTLHAIARDAVGARQTLARPARVAREELEQCMANLRMF